MDVEEANEVAAKVAGTMSKRERIVRRKVSKMVSGPMEEGSLKRARSRSS